MAEWQSLRAQIIYAVLIAAPCGGGAPAASDLKSAVVGRQAFRYGADFVEYDLLVNQRRLMNGTDAPP